MALKKCWESGCFNVPFAKRNNAVICVALVWTGCSSNATATLFDLHNAVMSEKTEER
jgi:hypothetical protein